MPIGIVYDIPMDNKPATTSREPIAKLSIDAQTLYGKALKLCEVGQLLTYDQLSKLIGRDVREHAYGALQTARRIAEREDGIAFGTITNVGLKRLNDVEVIGTADKTLAHIRRTASRSGRRVLWCLKDFDKLSDEKKVEHNARVSALTVLATISKNSAIRRIEGKVDLAQNGPLPIGRTLQIFQGEK